MTQELTDPFLILLEMEKNARAFAHTLPLSENSKRQDTFIRFHCGDHGLAADIGHVAEITRVPAITRVPGVHSWVKGLANIRGHLIAVIDLSDLLFKKKSLGGERSRIFVVDHSTQCGVLVDHIEGLQTRQVEDWCSINTLDHTIADPGKTWIVNLRDLVKELNLFS